MKGRFKVHERSGGAALKQKRRPREGRSQVFALRV